MSKIINEGFEMVGARSLDGREGKIVGDKTVPYDSKEEALKSPKLEKRRRRQGLTIQIWNASKTVIEDWQWVAGVEDNDLVKKPGGGDGGIDVMAGDNITINKDDPAKPIINATDPLLTVTKAEADILISNEDLIPGQSYLITGVDPGLYGGTDIILKAASTKLFEKEGSGFFYNPKYTSDSGYGIWTRYMKSDIPFDDVVGTFDYKNREGVTAQNGATGVLLADGFIEWVNGDWSAATSITGDDSGATATVTGFTSPSYGIGDNVIWGGKHWVSVAGNIGDSVDQLTLNSEWQVVSFDEANYNLVSDYIEYDYVTNIIYRRKDKFGSDVSGVPFLVSMILKSLKLYQWGNNPLPFGLGGSNNNLVVNGVIESLNSLGSIADNKITGLGSSIQGNILSRSGSISRNTFEQGNNAGSIDNNVIGGSIYDNKLQGGYINGNTIGVTCDITFCGIKDGRSINNNALSKDSKIHRCIISGEEVVGGDINNNVIKNGGGIVNVISVGVDISSSSVIDNKTIGNIKAMANGSTEVFDFSAATHVFAHYTKNIFTRQDGTLRLSYYNNIDTLKIVNVDA